MANRQPSRKIAVLSEDAVRWQRRLKRVLFTFIIMSLVRPLAVWSAPPVVQTVLGLVLILGFAGLISVVIVLGVKSVHHFQLVFTTHRTQPKEVTLALARLEYRRKGIATRVWPSVRLGLAVSCLVTLIWLACWGTSKLDPSTYAIPFPWALALILFYGIGCAAFPHLGNFLDALFSSKTVGFDKEWMGYLRGQPGKALWRYGQIARVRLETMRTGEREFRLMIAVPHEGREVGFDLSNEVDVRQITGILAGNGVEVVNDTL